MKTTSEECAVRPAARETWAVAVVYEDTVTRDRAMSVCDGLVQQFWTEVEFEISWWRENYLADSAIARQAGAAAANADLIVFSTHAGGELTAGTTAWIETWLDTRKTREGALIGLIGTADDSIANTDLKHRYLNQIAERGGLDYLSSVLPNPVRELEDYFESIHRRADQMTSVLDQILKESPSHQSVQRWMLED